MTYEQMTAYAGLNVNALYLVGFPYSGRELLRRGPVKDAIDAFYRAFDEAGVKPDSAPGDAWDPGSIVVSAFRTLGTRATAAQVHDYIEHLRNYAGIDGLYDFVAVPQRGIGESSAVMTRWEAVKGTWVAVR